MTTPVNMVQSRNVVPSSPFFRGNCSSTNFLFFVIISSPLIDLFLPAPQDIAARHVSRTDIQTDVLSPAGSKITMREEEGAPQNLC